jgi:hypothetical protein
MFETHTIDEKADSDVHETERAATSLLAQNDLKRLARKAIPVVYCNRLTSASLLIEESQYFSSCLFASGFFMCHNSIRCGNQNVTELTTGQQVYNPLFDFTVLDIKAGGNDTTLVQASRQLDYNLVGSMIINDLELSNIACSIKYGKRTR